MTQRKKKRNTSGANSQAAESDLASLNNGLRSDPMQDTHKANGHTPESTTRQDISTFENWAASDDAGGNLVAETAASAAACANRDAYAEMAQAESEGKRLSPPRAASRPNNANRKASDKKKVAPEIPPATEPLPADGASFVEAVHEKVDLIELEVSLLKSEDEKIRQRELAYLRELKYGKIAAFSTDDEMPQIIFDDGPSFPNPDSRDPAGD